MQPELKPLLHIQLSFKSLLLFMFFFFLMHELHELAHVFTGRAICGCWGTRDFNVWGLCEGCIVQHPAAVAATFAGPVFTFVMLWLGWYWLSYGKRTAYRSIGLVMILGNMQFGRMYMAAMGGGDEISGLRFLFLNADHSNAMLIKVATFVIVSAICSPPLWAAYKAIGNKKKILIYISFLIVPLVLDTIVVLMVLNGILTKGTWNEVWLMGTPLVIYLWFILCLLIVLTGFKSLARFAKTAMVSS